MPELDTLPFVDTLPSAKDLVETSFSFAEELLATQKDFAIKVIGTVTPKASPPDAVDGDPAGPPRAGSPSPHHSHPS